MPLNRKRFFVAIIFFVIMVHIVVIWSLHAAPPSTQQPQDATAQIAFSTRTIPPANPTPTPTPKRASETVPTPIAPSPMPAHSPPQEPTKHHETTESTEDPTPTTPTIPAEAPGEQTSTLHYRVAAPAIAQYDIKGEINGFAYFANGELRWHHNGNIYDAQLRISHFLLGSRTQNSSGTLSANGLEPHRFSDKVRTEVVAKLDHAAQRVTFAADGSHIDLEPGAQDQLSIFLQLGALLAGMPERHIAGDRLTFQAIGARSAEYWTFEIGSLQPLHLPGGTFSAIPLKRILSDPNTTQVEVWLAPSLDYLPVRIRLFQANGDFVEQQWRSIRRP
jgi:hypothetical protein